MPTASLILPSCLPSVRLLAAFTVSYRSRPQTVAAEDDDVDGSVKMLREVGADRRPKQKIPTKVMKVYTERYKLL